MYYCNIPNIITKYDTEIVPPTRHDVARNEIKEIKIT
jgi:hypothetical protein